MSWYGLRMNLDRLSRALGKGLVAGFVGTAAMTASSTLEARLRTRNASTVPADAAQKALGIRAFQNDAAKARFSTLVHWGYGTGWGVMRGVLRELGLPPAVATAGHFATVWGSSLLMLPLLDLAPPVSAQAKEEVAIDALHHVVYAVGTAAAYERLL